MDYKQIKGTIFNIQRYSTDDGPGVRTTVFMKGCPLRCLWCSNPESLDNHPQLLYRYTACKRCGRCIQICPNHALSMGDDGIVIDRSLCTACGLCSKKCLLSALNISGSEKTVEEVFNIVKRDKDYYDQGGGGCTCSGGEILSQPDFVAGLFRMCRENGIHTNADTSGYGSREALVKIMEYADMFYYDLKIIDPDAHERYTGVHNGVILDNLRYLAGSGISVVIRVPLIHTINDTEENLTALAKTVLDVIPAATVNFLPYHEYGSNKYRSIGKQYGMPALEPMTEEQKAIAVDWIRSFGLKCVIS